MDNVEVRGGPVGPFALLEALALIRVLIIHSVCEGSTCLTEKFEGLGNGIGRGELEF